MFTKTAASIALAASAVTGFGLMEASSASAARVGNIIYANGCDTSIYYGQVDDNRNEYGRSVATIQRSINSFFAARGWKTRIVVDGAYGSGTRSAVMTVQRTAGLTADGVVGPKTASVLGLTIHDFCA